MEQIEYVKYSMCKGIPLWYEYIKRQNIYLNGALLHIKQVNSDKKFSRDSSADLFKSLNELMQKSLSFYTKLDLSCLLVLLRQKYRVALDLNYEGYWEHARYFKLLNILLECIRKSDLDFEGHSVGDLEGGYHNLITAFSLADAYGYLKEKAEVILPYEDEISIARFVELTDAQYREDDTRSYFEKNRGNASFSNPEEYVIANSELKRKVISEKKDLTVIDKQLDKFFLENLGISSKMMDDIGAFTMVHLDDFRKYELPFSNGLVLLNKTELYNRLSKGIDGIKREDFEGFMNIFRLKKSTLDNEPLEYMSIVEEEGVLAYGPYDLMQNVATFRNLCKSGQNSILFKCKNTEKVKSKEHSESIRKKMTDYFVICICDMFLINDYIVPISNGYPMYEIKKIVSESNKNILQEAGDIDVLVLSKARKIIYNIEAKYYQPAKNYKEMRYADERRLESKETIKKVKVREQRLKENIVSVLKMFDISENQAEYEVESLIVTARENFYLADTEKIKSLNWINLCTQIKDRKL